MNPLNAGQGKCLKPETIANFGYAFSAMDILFDWLFALMPVPMLWDVKMTVQLKLSIFLILGLGVLYVYFIPLSPAQELI